MKVYKNLVNAVAETLQEIFSKDRYADKAIEKKIQGSSPVGKQRPEVRGRSCL